MTTEPINPIAQLRKDLGLTLDEFAAKLNLKSKGYASELEKGARCSVRVALAIEALSEGEIPAASLNPDVALVDAAREGMPPFLPSASAAASGEAEAA